ncbi:MAG: DUF4279 domain-containing protein [Gemmataceae bacterium]|nr:DUF4279 domain-containing protein [Gemmataceae bacterium]
MVRANEQYAYFALWGEFEPADVTARVGVPPTECWRNGDVCPRQMERKFSRWALYSRLDHGRALEDHIRDVLAQLDANSEAFRSASAEFGGVMQLVGYFFRDYPGIHFDRDATEGLARYGLEVDFDFYGLYSHHREDT